LFGKNFAQIVIVIVEALAGYTANKRERDLCNWQR
jgi:hypothetical protein